MHHLPEVGRGGIAHDEDRIGLQPPSQAAGPVASIAVCDEAGHIVGRYIPVGEGANPLISREEIERRKQSKDKAYTTAEVLAHLEKI